MSNTVENIFKYGSETVANERGIDQVRIDSYAMQHCQLSGGLIIVTSGAVMIGRAEAPHIDDDQVLAGIGSAGIVVAWKQAFAKHDRIAGQVLATDDEMSNPGEGSTLRTALYKDIHYGVVPIINTNDKLNIAELAKRHFKGENDGPAAHIAVMMRAKRLGLMTRQNGLFDDQKEIITRVPYNKQAHRSILTMIESRGSKWQRIYAKVMAAISAADGGVAVHIAGANQDIEQVINGKTGTYFEPKPVEWNR